MNIDKSNQANGGDDMKLIGDFTNGTSSNVYARCFDLFFFREGVSRLNQDFTTLGIPKSIT